MTDKPGITPQNPNFSSGPCSKRPGWSLAALEDACLGRSHRSKPGKAKLKAVIDRSKAILGMPEDYVLGIVPASDTGAVEMALWSLLGPRPVDVFAWESFSKTWAADVRDQLKLDNLRIFDAPYGAIPDLSQADPAHDIIFAWNGTTSGVRVPNADWIAADRAGLTICDATSAAFAMAMDWQKLDVVTWSWQKVLGGEAAHGMIALSPRAVTRLESHEPAWPMPKIFRLTKKGKLNDSIFEGSTINTPSMLATEDALDGLTWAESKGGLSALIKRSLDNLAAIERWVEARDWVDFLADNAEIRSSTSICLKFTDPVIAALPDEAKATFAKAIAARLDTEGAAYDIGAYRDAPPGLRIWGGGTVETSDIETLLPWIDWAYETERQALRTAA